MINGSSREAHLNRELPVLVIHSEATKARRSALNI